MLHPMVYMDADWNGFQNMIKAKDCLPMIFAVMQKGGKNMIKAEWTNADALNLQSTCNQLATDCISRQAAIDAILHNQEVYSNNFGNDPIDKYTIAIIDNDAQTIAQLPSADVQPVRHGVWTEENRRPKSAMFYCSECHRTAYDIQPTRDKTWEKRCRYAYCPNCGARMDGE